VLIVQAKEAIIQTYESKFDSRITNRATYILVSTLEEEHLGGFDFHDVGLRAANTLKHFLDLAAERYGKP
jgi:hypothetical protein